MKMTKTISVMWMVCTIMFSAQPKANAGIHLSDYLTGTSSLNCPTSVYQLQSFSGVKGTQPGGMNTAVLTWTASGETQITGYDLECFSYSSPVGSFASSNLDDPITRTFTHVINSSNYAFQMTYRLKIYHVDGSVSYSNQISISYNGKKLHKVTWP